MTCLTHVFDLEELEKLDEKQLAILDSAILHEIRTNARIKDILKKEMTSKYYRRWTRAAGAQGTGGTRRTGGTAGRTSRRGRRGSTTPK
jgi:hypothetical protein